MPEIQEYGLWLKDLIADDTAQKGFRTYYNYVTNIRNFLQQKNLLNELSEIKNSKFKQIQGSTSDLRKIEKLLRIAWGTENVLDKYWDSDIAEISVTWAPVQVYYTIYAEIRALLISITNEDPSTHVSALKQINCIIRDRPSLFPLPWRSFCGTNLTGNCCFVNFEQEVDLAAVESLKKPTLNEFWNNYGLFLKTTRDRELIDKFKIWKKDNGRKKIQKPERIKVANNHFPTTLFNALKRLRIRCNYDDIEIFLDGSNNAEKKEFFGSLLFICKSSLLILEFLLARHIKKNEYAKMVEKLALKYPNGSFVKRWTKLKELW